MKTDRLQGHDIYRKDDEWFYCDTNEPTVNSKRNCGYCGRAQTIEGHDGCIGAMPNVINACCGHGCNAEAYIQFADGEEIRGEDAMEHIQAQQNATKEEENEKYRNNKKKNRT